jgi:hypothetical protein
MEPKIVQIAIDSSEEPSMGFIFGLGEDSRVYKWNFHTTKWELAVRKEKTSTAPSP